MHILSGFIVIFLLISELLISQRYAGIGQEGFRPEHKFSHNVILPLQWTIEPCLESSGCFLMSEDRPAKFDTVVAPCTKLPCLHIYVANSMVGHKEYTKLSVQIQ